MSGTAAARTPVATSTPVPNIDWTRITAAPSVPMGPLVFANYYAWFDMNTWITGITPDLPLQLYLSAETTTMERHLAQAQGAGIDAFNLAWLGPGNPTDSNLTNMLPLAAARGMHLTAGFETDSPFFHTRRDFIQALKYAHVTHMAQPGYLRVDGRPVLFFWRQRALPLLPSEQSSVEAWRAIRDEVDPWHQAIWIAEGDRFEYLEVFDGIYPYSIAWADDVDRIARLYAARTRQQQDKLGARKLWVATVMPGYSDLTTGRADAFRRDREAGGFYEATWAAAVGTNPDWVMITSWNEWVEGSQIEPSRTYGDQYVAATLSWAFWWKTAPADAHFDESEFMAETEGGPTELVAVQTEPSPVATASNDQAAQL